MSARAEVAALADEMKALRAHVADLEGQVKARPAPPVAPAAPPPTQQAAQGDRYGSILGLPIYTTSARPDSGFVLPPVGVVLSGFAQVQYLSSQLSADQVAQGGTPENLDRFALRLARLRADGSWNWARFALELSGNTIDGNYFGVLRAEASFLWRNPKAPATPYVMLTGGLQEISFGYELSESQKRRPFMERTQGSLALFPGTTDLGLRLSGGVSYLRYAVAAMNGVPLVEHAGAPYQVTTKEKQLLGRLGVDSGTAARGWSVAAGVSFLTGTGFRAGTSATPAGLAWRDTNENGVVDPGEIVGVAAQAALPSVTFSRWAVGADAELRIRSKLGWTQLYGELVVATNLDRGLYVADPVASGYDLRELAAYAAVTQEIFRYGLIGFRWDYYNPDIDFTDSRRGLLVPASETIQTFSPLVGVQAFDHLRLLFQYDFVRDSEGRTASGVPTDLPNNQWTVRLQGEF